MSTFAELGVPADLVTVLDKLGATAPFPIQHATIPDLLAGRDVCGRAPTGSGKTLAFGIPLAARVGQGASRRPRALVLAPTRELADQIHRELAPLVSARGRRSLTVYGGVGYGPQRKGLRKGVDVVVACPGRLEDLIGEGTVELADVDLVVIDEADRMADMGFLPAVKRLLDSCRRDRQTALFSATLDGDVAVLTKKYQRDARRHEVGEVEPDITAARHHFWRVAHQDRREHTAQVVRSSGQTIVFCRTRRGADRLTKQLKGLGVSVAAIHGGRTQGQRDRALAGFAAGRTNALVATDVAARGIHVDDVACVIHFDPPADAKTYLHRSGRTARAGATGTVVSLVRGEDAADTRRMQRELGLPADLGAPTTLSDRAGVAAARPEPVETNGSRPTGRVKWFDPKKGYGFIEVPQGSDMFVHHSNIAGDGQALVDGQNVEYDVEPGRRGDEAKNVRVLASVR